MQTILVVGSSTTDGGFQPCDLYGIPVHENSKLLTVQRITASVNLFRLTARSHLDKDFLVTCVGCGEGGYQPGQIADLFCDMPDNVYLQARLAYGLK